MTVPVTGMAKTREALTMLGQPCRKRNGWERVVASNIAKREVERAEAVIQAARAFLPYSDAAEMRWMSMEDAPIEVRARFIAELCRALAAFDKEQP